jgi:hypothetical protein
MEAFGRTTGEVGRPAPSASELIASHGLAVLGVAKVAVYLAVALGPEERDRAGENSGEQAK